MAPNGLKRKRPSSSQTSEVDRNVSNGKDENGAARGHGHGIPNDSIMDRNMPYTTDVFQLQTQEMLERMRKRVDKKVARLDACLKELKTLIEHIPEEAPLKLSQVESDIMDGTGMRVPFPHPRPASDIKYTFSYSKPSNINVIGSYTRKTSIVTQDLITADLALTMPSAIFQEKDYLNYRYFYKRAYYLSYIFKYIKHNKKASLDIKYVWQNSSALQPIILVTPRDEGKTIDGGLGYQVRIILAVDESLFPMEKLRPERNNIRHGQSPAEDTDRAATPYYNATLRSECCTLSVLKALHWASSQSKGFSGGCILGAIWLRQRAFGTSSFDGGFGAFEWAYVSALLMHGDLGQKSKLSRNLDAIQTFRSILQYVATGFGRGRHTEFDATDPLLFDSLRGFNILFKMTPWSYTLLLEEAKETLRVLSDANAEKFKNCFIFSREALTRRYDYEVALDLSSHWRQVPSPTSASEHPASKILDIHSVLKRALGDRVVLINIHFSTETVSHMSSHSKESDSLISKFVVGLISDPTQFNRTIDRGPSADDKEAAESFRKFWGDKADLRRFKDGSIQESVIWTHTATGESIPAQIVTHVLTRHFGTALIKSFKWSGDLDKDFSQKLQVDVADALNLFQPVMQAFEKLESDLRALQGLPLHIRQVSAAAPQLRYTSIQTPLLKIGDLQNAPLAVNLQFEGSYRWPGSLAAIQRTKIAFLLKIGELLEDSNSKIATKVGLDRADEDSSNIGFLEIQYPSGALFQLRIHHEGEIPLLEQKLKNAPHSDRDREVAATALSKFKHDFIQIPLLNQAIRTLCTRFPLLSPTIRLLKLWRDSHLLSSHVADEVTELVAVHIFVNPSPWVQAPGSIQTAFLRVIDFIARWNWQTEPLIVDYKGRGHTDASELEAIRTRFEAWRKIDPGMNRVALFVATMDDPSGTTWTENGPSKVIAARLTSLAQAASRQSSLSSSSSSSSPTEVFGLSKLTPIHLDPLFVPSLADYDFIIHLNPEPSNSAQSSASKSRHRSTSSSFKNLQGWDDNVSVIPHDALTTDSSSFQPIQSLLADLRSLYGSNIIFFHNESQPSLLAGLWNPQTGPRPWKVNLTYSTIPSSSGVAERVRSGRGAGAEENGDDEEVEESVTINKAAVLHDIARLGGDMISRIEVKDSRKS